MKKLIVKKTSFIEEQENKDRDFLKLKPAERLKIHEELRKRIWGDLYNKTKLKGLKVYKKSRDEFVKSRPVEKKISRSTRYPRFAKDSKIKEVIRNYPLILHHQRILHFPHVREFCFLPLFGK